ncbi:MAG: tripartite tricarboxylate transporter TctB family protein [Pseudomonadota bacterium]
MQTEGKMGSLLISVFFVFAGIITLWDTQSYSDADSQVFPQAVAIALILCASLTLIVTFINGDEDEGFGQGIWWRRLLLVAALLSACFLMPIIGFLPAAIVSFTGGLFAAMHDRWSLKKALIYGVSGLTVMSAFYSLFRFVLLVPLP